LELLDLFIQIEISNCKQFETIFRGNSLTTKLFKFYSKIVGLPYLFHTLASNIFEICSADPEESTENIDAEKKS